MIKSIISYEAQCVTASKSGLYMQLIIHKKALLAARCCLTRLYPWWRPGTSAPHLSASTDHLSKQRLRHNNHWILMLNGLRNLRKHFLLTSRSKQQFLVRRMPSTFHRGTLLQPPPMLQGHTLIWPVDSTRVPS